MAPLLRASDASLAARAAGGDARAFEQVYERYQPRLLSYCRHSLTNRDDAEDALQQTFVRVHRALLSGGPPNELRPWLYAVARNCCRDVAAARRPTAQLSEAQALHGLSQQVHDREDLRALLGDLGRLPEDQRTALLLSELEGMPHAAIAEVIGTPPTKIKALVYQARSTLLAERVARDVSCRDIREQLAVGTGGALRRGPLRRHLRQCDGCRAYGEAVQAQRRSLALVLPVLPSAGLLARVLSEAGHASAASGAAAGATGATGAGGVAGHGAAAGASAGAGAGAGAAGAAGAGAAGSTAASSGVAALAGGTIPKLAAVGAAIALTAGGAVAIKATTAAPSHPKPTPAVANAVPASEIASAPAVAPHPTATQAVVGGSTVTPNSTAGTSTTARTTSTTSATPAAVHPAAIRAAVLAAARRRQAATRRRRAAARRRARLIVSRPVTTTSVTATARARPLTSLRRTVTTSTSATTTVTTTVTASTTAAPATSGVLQRLRSRR